MAGITPLIIDGSYLEGGGQILRMSLALSAVNNLPITVNKVRAGRTNPGLRPQHLTGLQLVRDASLGKLDGGHIGSCEITFYPGNMSKGNYMADTQTAGSVTLLGQAVLPCALFANGPSRYILRGGTNADFAPQADYYIHVFRPILSWFGIDLRFYINRRGFYPQGRGEVSLEVKPASKGITPADFTDFGELVSVYGKAFVSGVLPIKVAHIMADTAEDILREAFPSGVDIRVERIKEHPDKAVGNGSGIVLWATTSSGCVLGGSALGKKGRDAQTDGRNAAQEIVSCVKRRVCLDDYAQDQVIIYMALAKGKSIVRTGALTKHTQTAIWLAQQMCKVEFKVTPDEGSDCVFVECEGIGALPPTT